LNIAVPLGGLVMVMLGFVLVLRSMWLRKPNNPTITGGGGWKFALFPWRYKDLWASPGYKYYIIGEMILIAGWILLAINNFVIE